MKTILRSAALLSVLSLIAAPVARAERMGANPHPQGVVAPDSNAAIVAYTVLVILGA